jgi:membrane protein YdbS with pleckstrin-like domain
VFSPTVNRPDLPKRFASYLLANENVVVLVRHHIAYIAGAVILAPLSLVIVIIATILANGHSGIQEILWLLWLIPMGYCVWKYADWRLTFFGVTAKRLLLVSGVFGRSVATLPLVKVTDLALQQSPLARTLEYAEFDVESAGENQRLRNIRFVPYPGFLYLEIMAQIHPDIAGDQEDPGF